VRRLLRPALITLLRPRGEPRAVGFRHLAKADRLLLERRRVVLAIDQRVGKSLSLRHLDLLETKIGPRLRLKTS